MHSFMLDDAFDMDAIRQVTEAGSDSDVVRSALIHLETMVDAILRDPKSIFSLRDLAGNETPLTLGEQNAHLARNAQNLRKHNMCVFPSTVQRIQRLKSVTGPRNDSELVRFALLVYQDLVCAGLRQESLIVTASTGDKAQYLMPAHPLAREVALLPRTSRTSSGALSRLQAT